MVPDFMIMYLELHLFQQIIRRLKFVFYIILIYNEHILSCVNTLQCWFYCYIVGYPKARIQSIGYNMQICFLKLKIVFSKFVINKTKLDIFDFQNKILDSIMEEWVNHCLWHHHCTLQCQCKSQLFYFQHSFLLMHQGNQQMMAQVTRSLHSPGTSCFGLAHSWTSE